MAEYIDRQAAKEQVCGMCDWEGTSKCETCVYPIDDIPTAEVRENIKGEWVAYNAPFTDTLCCSVCGFNILPELGDYNFCPNCGADMKKTCDGDQGR